MSDTPKLVKELFVRELNDAAAMAGGLPLYSYPKASVAEVVAWLREQGAGEEGWKCVAHNVPVRWETATNCTAGAYSPNTCDIRPVLAIPLGGNA